MDELKKIKMAVLRALMSDEILMYGLVLKGGNALSLAYEITDRGSVDIDFSIEKDFSKKEYIRINNQLNSLFRKELEKAGYFPFDIKFFEKPKTGKIKNWKGYQIEFKLIDLDFYFKNKDDIEKLRRNALPFYENNSTKYTIDISAYEYIEKSSLKEIDGMLLRVYTPEMLIIEKIRAMCQSMKKYQSIIPTANEKKRARDIYDIYKLYKAFSNEINPDKELVRNIFDAKSVPLEYLYDFEELRESYRLDWVGVLLTIHQDKPKEEFDYYFNFVSDKIKEIIILLGNTDSIR